MRTISISCLLISATAFLSNDEFLYTHKWGSDISAILIWWSNGIVTWLTMSLCGSINLTQINKQERPISVTDKAFWGFS
jgi:hypothetical protein